MAPLSGDLALPLSQTLQTLVEGTTEDKIRLILTLHRRYFHKPAEELRTILQRLGIPIRSLALVKTAIDHCEVCRRWQRVGAKPAIKFNLSPTFNQLIYGDVAFIGNESYLLLVDDAVRFCIVHEIDLKDFTGLEQAFRRGWLAHFGPPAALRTDKERALATDKFGLYQ